ncbi:MAG: hypothetical protein WBR26_03325 [Candidatus Acidiferrum sp.]
MNDEWTATRSRTGQERMPTQLEVVRQVMLLAARYDSWLTLEELARKTKFAEASISAQLRHLRKEEHGAFEVGKRRRMCDENFGGNGRARVWEYQVKA